MHIIINLNYVVEQTELHLNKWSTKNLNFKQPSTHLSYFNNKFYTIGEGIL
jgi:hypothetical protein